MKNVELHCNGIKCDHCDYKDNSVKVEDYKDWLNKPCPKCGENLLTQEDYNNALYLIEATNLINEIPPDSLKNLQSKTTDELSDMLTKAGIEDKKESDGDRIKVTIDTHKEIRISDVRFLKNE